LAGSGRPHWPEVGDEFLARRVEQRSQHVLLGHDRFAQIAFRRGNTRRDLELSRDRLEVLFHGSAVGPRLHESDQSNPFQRFDMMIELGGFLSQNFGDLLGCARYPAKRAEDSRS
jgi:hypothetical protein